MKENHTPNYTPNANMADRSVGARHESHESEASFVVTMFPQKVLPCH